MMAPRSDSAREQSSEKQKSSPAHKQEKPAASKAAPPALESVRVSVSEFGVYGARAPSAGGRARPRCADCPLDSEPECRCRELATNQSRAGNPIIIVEPKNDDSMKCDCRNCQFLSGWCCMPCLLVIFLVLLVAWLCWSGWRHEPQVSGQNASASAANASAGH